MPEQLTYPEREILLTIARRAIEAAVRRETLPGIDLATLPEPLQKPGVVFITLTQDGSLRGCIGALEAYQPLVEDVYEHAIAAAMYDYRFDPVRSEELDTLKIEISRLTPPEEVVYNTPEELVAKLIPAVDGVILRYGKRRATFLPQVWEKIPDPAEFLDHLCLKMGAPADFWRQTPLTVQRYQVEEFHE